MNPQEIAALICGRLGECLSAIGATLGYKGGTAPAGAAAPAAVASGMSAKEKANRDKVNAAASEASVRLKNAGVSQADARARVLAVLAEHGGGAKAVADIPADKLKAVHEALTKLDEKPAEPAAGEAEGW